jgi:hypothetical protein
LPLLVAPIASFLPQGLRRRWLQFRVSLSSVLSSDTPHLQTWLISLLPDWTAARACYFFPLRCNNEWARCCLCGDANVPPSTQTEIDALRARLKFAAGEWARALLSGRRSTAALRNKKLLLGAHVVFHSAAQIAQRSWSQQSFGLWRLISENNFRRGNEILKKSNFKSLVSYSTRWKQISYS